MDPFISWSTQYAAEPCLPSRPSDDDGLLISACLTSFHDGNLVHFNHGSLDMPSSQTFAGLDTLPSVTTGAVDGSLCEAFTYVPRVAEATVSNTNTVFSDYCSTVGGNGNISSGESNTCGGQQDIEVASPCAAVSVSRPAPLHHTPMTTPPSSKRKLNRYLASATTAATTAELRRGKRAAALSSSSSTSITFGGGRQRRHRHHSYDEAEDAEAALAQVKETVYRAAAMRPVHQLLLRAADEPPSHQNNRSSRRRNVRISSDPQTVAARLRRERVSERLRVLQRLVPGGSRMDTASMLDEAASYLRFLKSQLQALESAGTRSPSMINSSDCLLQQNYHAVNNLATASGGGGGAVLAFGSRDGVGGYVKSNRDMPLYSTVHHV